MKLAITRFAIVAAIAVLVVVLGGSTAAWAQTETCYQTTPNYSPDFANNQACLTLTGTPANSPYPGFYAPASTQTPPGGTPNAALPAPANVATVLRLTTNSTFTSGSAWFTVQQPVAAPFSTTFTFQLSDTNTSMTADGFAFVIQNSSVSALDPDNGADGCSLGYGDDPAGTGCTSATGGIPNSVAVEFDTYQNGDDPNNNHVAIQSCGTAANSSDNLVGGVLGDPAPCNIAINPLTGLTNPVTGAPITITLADGSVHSATITYTPTPLPTALNCIVEGTPVPCIDVTLDGVDLFNGGVPFNMASIGLNNGAAWVGFTGATGGDDEDTDILGWTFTPQTIQGTPITPATLVQTAAVTIAGNPATASFDYSHVAPTNLVIAPGTIPFFGFSGETQLQFAASVANTAMGGTTCLLVLGLEQCEINTFTASTLANPMPAGSNLPTDNSPANTREVLFTQTFILDPNQGPPVDPGMLMIPAGTAPGIAEFSDSGTCPFPAGDPLFGQICPRSIMTSIVDGPTKPGGTPKPAASSQVFFCCEPEWATVPTINLWTNNPASIPVSFQSTPPPANPPISQPAQGKGVSFGAVAAGVVLDPALSFPTEQTALNAIACPNSPLWSEQMPLPFNAMGTLTTYDNSGVASSFGEGPYSLLYAPLDCDEFLGLQYPPSINLNGAGTSPNLAQWNTTPFGVDLTNPTVGAITLNPPAPGSYYAVGATVKASMTCQDPTHNLVASGIASCGGIAATLTNGTGPGSFTATSAPLSTSPAGSYMFSFGGLGATDVAGNSSGAPTPVQYTVVGNADLAIGMLGGLLAKTGQTVTYLIGVANAGPSIAEEVTVVDTVPSYTTPVSATYDTGSCTFGNGAPSCSVTAKTPCGISGGVITCNIGALKAWTKGNPTGVGIQVTVKVNASVPADTKITNSVVVSGVANADPNLKNNTATWPTLVTN